LGQSCITLLLRKSELLGDRVSNFRRTSVVRGAGEPADPADPADPSPILHAREHALITESLTEKTELLRICVIYSILMFMYMNKKSGCLRMITSFSTSDWFSTSTMV
jgi:hypothetical protein